MKIEASTLYGVFANKYPCTNCKDSPFPKDCEWKSCPKWRAWFIEKWEETRQELKKKLEAKDNE